MAYKKIFSDDENTSKEEREEDDVNFKDEDNIEDEKHALDFCVICPRCGNGDLLMNKNILKCKKCDNQFQNPIET